MGQFEDRIRARMADPEAMAGWMEAEVELAEHYARLNASTVVNAPNNLVFLMTTTTIGVQPDPANLRVPAGHSMAPRLVFAKA